MSVPSAESLRASIAPLARRGLLAAPHPGVGSMGRRPLMTPKSAIEDHAWDPAQRATRSTKIRIATDLLGRPIAIQLTLGQHGDIQSAASPLAEAVEC